jgi:hypothetical protein
MPVMVGTRSHRVHGSSGHHQYNWMKQWIKKDGMHQDMLIVIKQGEAEVVICHFNKD